MQAVLIIFIFVGIGAYEAKTLLRDRSWKELGVMIGLLTMGLGVSLAAIYFTSFPRLFPLMLRVSERISRFIGLEP